MTDSISSSPNAGSLETIRRLSDAAQELLADAKSVTFDERLERFTQEVEELLLVLGDKLSAAETESLQRFAALHKQVTDVTAETRTDLGARIAALERNRPALLKYWIQKK